MNEKGRQTKLLVAIMAIFLVVVCASVAFSDSTNAQEGDEAAIGEESYATLADAIAAAEPGATIVLQKDVTLTATVVVNGLNIDGNGFTITTGDNIRINFQGAKSTIYNSVLTSPVNQAIVDVSGNAAVEIKDCQFEGTSTTAVYVNFATTTDVEITNCSISDNVMKEVILALGNAETGTVEINNCTGLRVNIADATEASEITLGKELVINDSPIDRLNIDTPCTLIIPTQESFYAGMIRGTGSIENNGVVTANTFGNGTDANNTFNITGNLGIRIPAGTSASVSGNDVTITGTPIAENDVVYKALFFSTQSLYSYVGLVGLTGNGVEITQVNPALTEAWPDEDAFAEDTKTGTYTFTETDNSYYFLISTSGDTATVTIGDKTYTFKYSLSGNAVSAESVNDANEALADETTTEVIIDGSKISGSGTTFEVPNSSKTLTIENLSNVTFEVKTGSAGNQQSAKFNGISATSLSITQGSVQIYGVDITADESGSVSIPDGTTVVIKDGTSFAGNVKFVAQNGANAENVKVQIPKSATVTIGDAATISFENMSVDIRGTINGGTISAGEGSTVTIDGTVTSTIANNGGTIVNNSVTGGPITLPEGTEIDSQSSIDGSSTQEIIVTGEVTVKNGGHISVNGLLTIAEGGELVLEQGSSLVIGASGKVDLMGTITVQAGDGNTDSIFKYNGSQMNISGTLDLEGPAAFESNGVGTINVTGTVNVGEDASANLKGMTVASTGSLNINGAATGTIVNAGTVTVDSEVASEITVQMRDGATLGLDNAVGTVIVTDDGLTFRYEGTDKPINANNGVTFTDISGITVTETLTTKTEKVNENSSQTTRVGYGNMYISGNADVATYADGTTATGTIVIDEGTVVVAAETTLDLVKDVTMTITGKLDVAGTVTSIEKDADNISGSGTLNVTGLVKTVFELNVDNINAAVYQDADKYYNYTTLTQAIATGATEIELLGTIVIDSDVTIPAGTTVDMDNAKAVTIDEDATVTVAFADNKSGKIGNDNINIDVKGTLVVENLKKSGITEERVLSDVATKNGDSAEYTSIYNALNNAESGATVTITREGTITLAKDIEIKSGVTLVIPAESTVIVDNGITVTVNGTLENDGTYTIEADDQSTTAEDPGATIVNGLFKTMSGDYTAAIDGAFFPYDGYNCIAPLTYVANIIDEVEGDVILYGDIVEDDVTVTYTAGDDISIIVDAAATLTMGTLNINGIDFVFNGAVSGTVVVADGSFALKNVTGGTITEVVTYEGDNEIRTATLSGAITNAISIVDDKKVALDGSVTISGTAAIANTSSVDVSADVIVAEGATVAVSNTDFIGNAQNADAGYAEAVENMVTVNGTLVLGNGVSFTNLTVIGTVSVETGEKYTASVGTLYVGVSVKENDDGKLVVTDLGVQAVVNGLTISTVAYVSPTSTVGTEITESKTVGSTEYYVEDALYVTAYATGSTSINDIAANVTDAAFMGWYNADDEPAYDSESGSINEKVGAEGFEKVYAKIEYNVYKVMIYTDGGIASVAVDGNVLYQTGNAFTNSLGDNVYGKLLTAGEHKITYTLKNGFQGEAVLSSDDLAVNGLNFTLTGDYGTTYILNLTGTEPADQTIVIEGGSTGGDSGMGLTDYLLIILVILIVIMAIMVAFRLMRS